MEHHRVRAASEQLCYDIIFTADLQLKLLSRKCTNECATVTPQLMVLVSLCALASCENPDIWWAALCGAIIKKKGRKKKKIKRRWPEILFEDFSPAHESCAADLHSQLNMKPWGMFCKARSAWGCLGALAQNHTFLWTPEYVLFNQKDKRSYCYKSPSMERLALDSLSLSLFASQTSDFYRYVIATAI